MRIELIRTLLVSVFPSWRFFDRPGEPFVLEVSTESASGPWQTIYGPGGRKWWNLFLNPQGNRAMAWQSLVDRLAREIDETQGQDVGAQVLQSLIYRKIKEGIEHWVDEAGSSQYHWRLVHAGDVILAEGPCTK